MIHLPHHLAQRLDHFLGTRDAGRIDAEFGEGFVNSLVMSGGTALFGTALVFVGAYLLEKTQGAGPVRQALRLDIGARLQAVREKLGKDLVQTQRISGGPEGCIKADVGRIEVTNVFAHDAYLRMYVKVAAQSAAYLPCPP